MRTPSSLAMRENAATSADAAPHSLRISVGLSSLPAGMSFIAANVTDSPPTTANAFASAGTFLASDVPSSAVTMSMPTCVTVVPAPYPRA